jgi:hypothetical protein
MKPRQSRGKEGWEKGAGFVEVWRKKGMVR